MHCPRVQTTLFNERHRNVGTRFAVDSNDRTIEVANRRVNNDVLWTSHHEPQAGEEMRQQVHVGAKFDAPDYFYTK